MHTIFRLAIPFFILLLCCGQAFADFYVIGGGKRYKRIITVSPVEGSETDSGAALLDAVDGIEDSGATNQYLVKLEPGTYDIGSEFLDLPSYVDLEGSGKHKTVIKGAGNVRIIELGSYCEVRQLQVKNSGMNTACIKIPAGHFRCYIENVYIYMGTTTGSCPGSGIAEGIVNQGSKTKIANTEIVSLYGYTTYGVKNEGNGNLDAFNVDIELNASCSNAYAVLSDSSSSTKLESSSFFVDTNSGVAPVFSVYNSSGDMVVDDCEIKATGGINAMGVYNTSGGSVDIRNSAISASGGTGVHYGTCNYDATGTDITVNNSIVTVDSEGGDYSLYDNAGGGQTYAGSCLLTASHETNGPSVKTINCYDDAYDAFP